MGGTTRIRRGAYGCLFIGGDTGPGNPGPGNPGPGNPAPATQAPATQVPTTAAPETPAPATEPPATYKDTMIIAIPGTPPGIDPNTQSAPQMWTIGAQLYGQQGMRWHQVPYAMQQSVADPNKVPGFWVADTDMTKIEPGVLESCTLASDGSKVDIKLRQGVKSAYGNEFTTADIEYGLDRSIATKAVGFFFLGVAGAQDRAQWKTIDKYTMQVVKEGETSLYNLCGLMTHLEPPLRGSWIPPR